MQSNRILSKRMISLVIFLVAVVAVTGCSNRQQIPWSGSYVGVSVVWDPNDPYDRYAEEPMGDSVYLEMMMDEEGNIQFKYADDEESLTEKEYTVLTRGTD